MEAVEIFTDGACRGNPGPGGWAAILRVSGHEKEIYGFSDDTTNNRMEMMAVIEAFKCLKQPSRVVVWTDSQYVQKGMMTWIDNWKRNQWKTAKRQPVKNADLWQELDSLVQAHDVTWQWVKGHAGHPENERVDALANYAIDTQ